MLQISHFPYPVVAQTHGIATAAGCQLAASCDLVFAEKNCKFATPGVNIGLFCTTPSVPIARSVNSKLANFMLFSGQPISAEEAKSGGLISKIIKDNADANSNHDYKSGALHPEVLQLCELIASKSEVTLRLGKKALREQLNAGSDLEKAYKSASKAMVANMLEDDAEEGIGSFLGKKKPEWDWEKKI